MSTSVSNLAMALAPRIAPALTSGQADRLGAGQPGGNRERRPPFPWRRASLGVFSMKIAVLGAGLVGLPMALDLAKDPSFDVFVADAREEPLDRLGQVPRVRTTRTDLSQPSAIQSFAR